MVKPPAIKLLALDIDGVLTDGRVMLSADGQEVKNLNFHDLDKLAALRRTGMPVVLVTGENNPMVEAIRGRFDVPVIPGSKDKLAAIQRVAEEYGVTLGEICYVGDSDRDAPALRAVGLGLAPANATPAAKAAAHRVLQKSGGEGAAAEAITLMEGMGAAGDESYTPEFQRIIEDSIAAHKRLIPDYIPVMTEVAVAFVGALKRGNKIMLFGNGGSAADAQHVAGELVGRFLRESQPWPAMALTTDTSILTAVGNDWEFEDVFGRQVRALARPGDVVVGISTSGKSPNVLRGLRDARAYGATTVGFTGAKGESMREAADICFCAPSDLTPRIQELHLIAWHAICELVENRMMD
jgi:D-sedoheptulose 7-phosphate isomerase